MELVENRLYTTEEMQQFFNVSIHQWKRKREQLLMHLSNYYDYEIQYNKKDSRKKNYFIIKKIADYEQPTKETKAKIVKRDTAFEKEIIDVIKDDNIQTAANISRIIKDKDDIKQLQYKDDTVYEYTRIRVRDWFGRNINEYGTKGRIVEKVWCMLDKDNNYYEELDNETIAEFYKMYAAQKESSKEEETEIFSDYLNGLITKEEMNDKIGSCGYYCFASARKAFREKYGFYPIKVPVYELSAFNTNEQ